MLNTITSPYLHGSSITEVWKSLLKEPAKYRGLSPEEFMNPLIGNTAYEPFVNYLRKRYW